MRSCDHILYQTLVETLIPDVLRPVPSKWPHPKALPPRATTQSCSVPSLANSSPFLTPGSSNRQQGAKNGSGQVPGFPEGFFEQGHPRVIN